MVAEVTRSWLRSLADAIAGKVPGKPDRLDTVTRMAMDADFSRGGKGPTPALEPGENVDQLAELECILKQLSGSHRK
jgi:hypothetical protein